jgi:hypothetical protein
MPEMEAQCEADFWLELEMEEFREDCEADFQAKSHLMGTPIFKQRLEAYWARKWWARFGDV